MARFNKSQLGNAGSSKRSNNKHSRKPGPNKPLAKKPIKIQKPRPETRDLIRWTDDLDIQTLLAINVVCHQNGIKIPFDDVGKMLSTHMDVSGSAIIQHLAKIRSRRVAANLPVPPPVQRGGVHRKSNNTGSMKVTKYSGFDMQPKANMCEDSDEDFDLNEDLEYDEYLEQQRGMKEKHENNSMSEMMKAQMEHELYNNLGNKVFQRFKAKPEPVDNGSFVAANATFLKLDDEFSEKEAFDQTNNGYENGDIDIYGEEGDRVETSESSDGEHQPLTKVVVLKVGTSKRAQAILRKFELPWGIVGGAMINQSIPGSSGLYGMEEPSNYSQTANVESSFQNGSAMLAGSAYPRMSAYQEDSSHPGGFAHRGHSAYQRTYANAGGPFQQADGPHQIDPKLLSTANTRLGYGTSPFQSSTTDFSRPVLTGAPSAMHPMANVGLDHMLFTTTGENSSVDDWALDWNDSSFDMWTTSL